MNDRNTPRHQRPSGLRKFLFGTPYYPEHWSEADRAEDPQRMASAGMNVVRMAEFAWDRIEPAVGKLDFSLFDETIARLGEVGIDTILCTPTATPPRWLTIQHEDWLRVDENGRRMEHGSRQHCCTTNEEFRAESRRITQAMAAHFAGHPRVIGWQTDNEFNCHFQRCYCQACVEGFRAWLKGKYGAIDKLNAAWGNAFWALTFDSFDAIPLPYPNSRPCYPNPTHELDYDRFVSDAVIEFQRQQVRILREVNPGWFVTHNGMFPLIDYWKFTEDLNFLGVDVYPGFGVKSNPMDSVWPAILNERCRASSGGYIIPEQQSGPGGQKPYLLATPAPGQMRLWAYQSIAHGADGVLHFRWRSCRFGAEEYWCGVLDHDNIPRRRYEEFSQEGQELQRIGPKILDTVLDVQAAVCMDYDQEAAYSTLPLGLPSPENQRDLAYRELWLRHLPCGLIQSADSFEGLKLLVWPSGPLMDSALAERMRKFVQEGGVLVVTARSATRNRDNQVIAQTPPGLLADLCGVTVEEFGKLEPGEMLLTVGGVPVQSGAGYEILSLNGAEAESDWLPMAGDGPSAVAGKPAIAVHSVGKGVAMYVGTFLSEANIDAILDLAMGYTDIHPLARTAKGVEVTRRYGPGCRLLFLVNHTRQHQSVEDLPEGMDLLSEKACPGQLTLPPFGVAIIEEA